jgi:methylenetetrahydrofolate reductase (NADPH)
LFFVDDFYCAARNRDSAKARREASNPASERTGMIRHGFVFRSGMKRPPSFRPSANNGEGQTPLLLRFRGRHFSVRTTSERYSKGLRLDDMRISVELVPRSEAEVFADASLVHAAMPEVNAFNIPDLMHFPLRSWDACAITSKILPASIPHIRAIDIPPAGDLPMAEAILASGLSEVLVIRGDPPRDLSRRTYPNTSDDIIRRFKRRHPKLKVFGAFDPYRQSFREELDAVARKVDAGADGFFTQPIFDLRLLEVCAEMLRGHNVFWGIAPVVGPRSRAYWETTNKIIFPSDFNPTLAWNRAFARSAIRAIGNLDANVYLMPIRVDLATYLNGLI